MDKKNEVPIEEQLARRQSAPRPTAMDEAQKMQASGMAPGNGAVDGFQALAQVIGKEQVRKARQILQKYKEGKANLEQKVIQSEQWYKLRHWECMRKQQQPDQVEPVSGWLFNSIANKHADAMDNFPSPNVLPREEGDKADAEMLTSIIPVILDQNDFEQTYSIEADDKLKGGTGIYGVFWNKSKLNGLGDISVESVDVLSLFWQPGVENIQDSRHFFHVALEDNEVLLGRYPQLQGRLGSSTLELSKFIYDDAVDTTEKSAVIDWYYKKLQGGKTILHYCVACTDDHTGGIGGVGVGRTPGIVKQIIGQNVICTSGSPVTAVITVNGTDTFLVGDVNGISGGITAHFLIGADFPICIWKRIAITNL